MHPIILKWTCLTVWPIAISKRVRVFKGHPDYTSKLSFECTRRLECKNPIPLLRFLNTFVRKTATLKDPRISVPKVWIFCSFFSDMTSNICWTWCFSKILILTLTAPWASTNHLLIIDVIRALDMSGLTFWIRLLTSSSSRRRFSRQYRYRRLVGQVSVSYKITVK